jgi:hypothetical protein
MKALDKNNKEARKERERAKNTKKGAGFYETGNPVYLSSNSHRKTNKKR